jgi:hypothetical protein
VTDFAGVVRQLRAEVGRLVEHRDGARSLDSFAKYRDDPVAFARDVLHANLWSKQEEVARLVAVEPLVLVASCNGMGKDFLVSHLALWFALCRRGLVLVSGPTERQVKDIVFGEIRRAYHRAGNLPGDLFELALRLDRNGERACGIIGLTSTSASSLTGYHAPQTMAVITEGQGTEALTYEAMLACCVGADARVVVVGNPLTAAGPFYDAAQSAHWRVVSVSAFEHPNITGEGASIPGGPTTEWIERMASEYGERSPTFEARVLGRFPEGGADDALVSRQWLESAALRWDRGVLEGDATGERYSVGVDVARFGSDATCIAITQGPVLRELVVWAGADTMATSGRITRELQARGLVRGEVAAWHGGDLQARRARLVVDAIGVGAGVCDRLRELQWDVKDYQASESPSYTVVERFQRKRDEAYWGLRSLLEAGAIALPRDPMLFEELLQLRWSTASNGRIQIEQKIELRKRLGRSPDRADAVAQAFSAYSAQLWVKPHIGGFLATF